MARRTAGAPYFFFDDDFREDELRFDEPLFEPELDFLFELEERFELFFDDDFFEELVEAFRAVPERE